MWTCIIYTDSGRIYAFHAAGTKRSVLPKKDKTAYQTKETDFDEDILTGIIANEVTRETEIEALKAQAVIARTNCYRAIKKGRRSSRRTDERRNDPHIWRRKFFRILQPVREQYRSNQRHCHDL